MTRGPRIGDGSQRKPLVTFLCIVLILLGLLFVYYGSFFGVRFRDTIAGNETSRKLGTDLAEDEDSVSNSSDSKVIKQITDSEPDEDADSTRQGGSVSDSDEDLSGVVLKSFPECDSRHSEIIPCLDRNLIYQMKLKLDLVVMEHYERHCPPEERRFNCLIPPPQGYKVPIKWPTSRDEVWKANIPHTHLAEEKSDQNWMIVNGDKINFPGGGTHFHDGADKYIAAVANMLKIPGGNLSNGGKIRTVLDVGCGVASFGAYLLPLDIVAMSLAPNDVHQNQIQFALERGIPATLGVLGTQRLPYPSRSFELVHCSRCRIDWLQRDGILLLEVDRVLRPGGYFVYSSPEAYMQDEENLQIWRAMSDLVKHMCWKVASKRDQTVIWVKPLTNDCYMKRAPATRPPLCSVEDDPDAAWHVPMKPCITPYSEQTHEAKGSGLAPWPKRLISPPPRLEELGIKKEDFVKDTRAWRERVSLYWKQMESEIEENTFRNIMDMKANLGGFAAAVKDKDVWVMNVVSANGPNTLKVIYDRGLIGTLHNWCESFSTYPRTYDLLHAWNVLSDVDERGCSLENLLLEMDRIVRPSGFIIIRDKPDIIKVVMKYMVPLRWDSWSSNVEAEPDAISSSSETILMLRKQLQLGLAGQSH